jgi:UDP-glucose 4-epimerase
VLDSLRTGYERNLSELDVDFIKGSVTDRAAVVRAVAGMDYVFHLAAMVSVPESMHEPGNCVEINAQGTLNVLRAAADAGVKKMTLSSSAAIYGDNPEVPKRESMVPEPKSPYAVTKLDGEYYCEMFSREGWLDTACLRYFNVFGPRQDPKSAYAAAVPIFICKALANEPLTVYGDGDQTRDFIFVKDIVGANVFFATKSKDTGVFNVAYGGRITINDLARHIIELTGSKSKIVHAPERAGDVKHSRAAVDRMTAAGYKPSGSFEAGLSETIAFFKRDRRMTV